MRILIIEDDFAIARLVRITLEHDGHDVAHAGNGVDGMDLVSSWNPDVVILDLMLPDMNGKDIARKIRTGSDVPIVMLTALGQETDRVTGLDAGADDYITKPFSVPELAARIRAVVRRTKGSTRPPPGPLQHRDLVLDGDELRVTKGGEELALTKREFEILRMLMQGSGGLVTRAEIAHAVWGRTAASASNLLDVHMSSLRKKLEEDGDVYIETVRGEGFRLRDDG